MEFSGKVSIIDGNGTYIKQNQSAINTYVDGNYIRFTYASNTNYQYAYALQAGKYVCTCYTSGAKVAIKIVDLPATATFPYLLINGDNGEGTPSIFVL